MASISGGLLRIKQDLRPFLCEAQIESACRGAGHVWRERQLGPVQTIHLFILQVLNFNTAMTGLRHLSHTAVKAPAYCRARMRLPLAALEALLAESASAMRQASMREGSWPASGLWCGLRTLLVDGSSTIAPDTPSSQKAFGQPRGQKPGCGFPVPKVLGLFDAFSGLMLQSMAFPLYTHEQSKVWLLHSLLGVGDLLVGDRGFCSFAHLAMLSARGVAGLFRMHQKQIVDFRPHRKHRRKNVKKGQEFQKNHKGRSGNKNKRKPLPYSRFVERLGRHDQIVQWFKPASRPKWMSAQQYAQLPESLLVRELRFVLRRKGQRTLCVTIATTLLDPTLYPRQKIIELYGVRWQVETHFGELKTTLKMRKLKSQTAEGVLKELAIYALVYNLVHMVMLKAAARQHVTPDRISFIDTVRWLNSAEPGDALPDLMVNPRRPHRHEPRVIKDLQDTYTKMTRPRKELRKELLRQRDAA